MSDPYELAHSLAKAVQPFNRLVSEATDQAYLIDRLQDEVKELREQRDEARRVAYCLTVEQSLDDDLLMTEMKAQIKLLMKQRDLAEMHHSETSIHADVIIKEASALITRCVESRKASAYWNAVEQFRQFEIRIT